MKKKSKKPNLPLFIVRWLARLSSGFLFLLIIAFIFGDGLPDAGKFSFTELLMYVCFLVLLTGLITGWFRELLGSIIIIFGFLGFWIVNIIFNGVFWLGWLFLIFPLSACLFFLNWKLKG